MKQSCRRRSIWTGIVVVAVFFACVTFAVAAFGGGPDIPHSVAGDRTSCTACHPVTRLPADHEGRTADGCRSCHAEADR